MVGKIDINTILYTIVFINDDFNELLRNIIYDNLTLVNTYKIILTKGIYFTINIVLYYILYKLYKIYIVGL